MPGFWQDIIPRFRSRETRCPLSDSRMANEEARARILEAAGPMFAAKGYQGATIREICEAAGVNLAAVNYHFRNKRTLYAASLGFALESTASRAPFPAWSPEEPAEVRLKECVCKLVKRMAELNDVAWQTRLILGECLVPTGIRREEIARFVQLPMDVLLSILQDLLPGDSLQSKRLWLGYSIMSQCMFARIAFAMLPQQHGDPPSSDEVAQYITDLSLAAISRFNQDRGHAS